MLLVTSLKFVQSAVPPCKYTGEGDGSSVTSHVVQNMVVWDRKYYVTGFSVFKQCIKRRGILKYVNFPH